MSFGASLRRERLRRHLSQEALAEALGTTPPTISRWERDQNFPHAHYRLALCLLFGVRPEELFAEAPGDEQAAPAQPFWHVPYSRNPFFTGREEILQRLHEMLGRTHTLALTQSLAVSGLGGIGKTQIALEYAHRYRHAYRFVFWASAATQEALLADVVAIADHLQLPERTEPDHKKVLKVLKQWFATHRGWLLILDNADNAAIVHDIVPTDSPGHLLLTSRAQALGPLLGRLDVEKMGMAEGTLLLLHRAKLLAPDMSLDQAQEEHLAAAEAIAIEMDFLPLALDQAGAYIDEVGCSLSAYLDLYRTHRKELLRRRGQVPAAHPDSVATTWSLNFQRVRQTNPVAADLLHQCVFLEPDTIPEELLTKGSAFLDPVLQPVAADEFALNAAIEELRKFSLVSRDPERRLLRMHRLVQAALKDAMEPAEQRQWAERVVRAINALFPETIEAATWPQCRRLLPQAQVCSEIICEYELDLPESASLLQRTALYLKGYALYPQAELLCQRALCIHERVLRSAHPDIASLHYQLGILSRLRGKYAEAEGHLHQVLHLCQHAGTSESSQIIQKLMAKTWRGLGNTYVDQGKYNEAEEAFRKAAELQEQIPDAEDTLLITILNGLGNVYLQQGKYRDAESTYQHALQIWGKLARPDDPEMAHALSNLAILYYEEGKYEQAKPLLTRAVEMREQAFGPEHPQIAISLTILGAISLAQGKYTEAEELHQRAFHIWEKALGLEHLQVAYSFIWLGKVYREQSQYEDAEHALQRALDIREQVLGPEHAQLVSPLTTLGGVYRDQGKEKEAEKCLRDALRIGEQTMGREHPDMIFPLAEWGSLQRECKNYEEAEEVLQRAVKLCEQHGHEHPHIASLLNELAECYRWQGKYTEAEPLYQHALRIWKQQLGPEHPKVASLLTGLASLYKDLGRYTESESLYQRALAIREHSLGHRHRKTMETRTQYLALLRAMGREENAVRVEKFQAE